MRKKYYILAFTFLCLLIGQSSFAQITGGDQDHNSGLGENGYYNGSGETWEDENGRLWAQDSDGRIYADINGDGILDRDEVIYYEGSDSTGTGSSGSNTNNGSGGSFSGWGGGTSGGSSTGDNQGNNDVASNDNYYYSIDSSGNIIRWNFVPTPYITGPYPEDWTTSKVDLNSYNPYDNTIEINSPSGVDLLTYENKPYGKIDSDGNVTILARDGTYKSPSKLNPQDDKDRFNLSKFAVYLARKLDGANKDIKITSAKYTKLASEIPAYTHSPPGTHIYLNSNGGFSKDLDNVNSFKSTLKHEILHVIDNINKVEDTYETHANVYLKQMKDDSFKDSNVDYQSSVVYSFCNYLLNIDQQKKRENLNYDHNIVISKINEFNLEHQGKIKIIAPEFGQYSLGNLSLSFEMNGYLPQSVKYTYEKE
ncbi:hypothetical protein [Flavobacterium gyeonganense]|uniref:Tox-MPTase2 domain-containing protein n=1 Tax=Flavobacterium gyeonganense TaxID=1310418 RepID=A0ABV5HAS5_9FLAO|nr:hypothetical protein [Flavobacterium gyeonganense]